MTPVTHNFASMTTAGADDTRSLICRQWKRRCGGSPGDF
jgi:hypothetical protein